MWHAIVEVILGLVTFVPMFDRSGPAAVDVDVDSAGRLLVLNAGQGSARSLQLVARPRDSAADAPPIPLENSGRIRVLHPEKWRTLQVLGGPVTGEWTVHASWREDGREVSADFALVR